MLFEKFVQPKKITIGDRTFIISQIPAIDAMPLASIISKAMADGGLLAIMHLPFSVERQILGYTALCEGINIVPETDKLFDEIFSGRVADAKALVIEMIKENFGFLVNGDLLERLDVRAEATDSAS